jgi:hypothetical protein
MFHQIYVVSEFVLYRFNPDDGQSPKTQYLCVLLLFYVYIILWKFKEKL